MLKMLADAESVPAPRPNAITFGGRANHFRSLREGMRYAWCSKVLRPPVVVIRSYSIPILLRTREIIKPILPIGSR